MKDSDQIDFDPEKKLFLSELSLKGNLRPVKEVFSFYLNGKKKGFEEAALINSKGNSEVVGIKSLEETINYLLKKESLSPRIEIEKNLKDV